MLLYLVPVVNFVYWAREHVKCFVSTCLKNRWLIFHKGPIRWLCSKSRGDEDLHSLGLCESSNPWNYSGVLLQAKISPYFHLFLIAINNYNERELIYPEDAAPAITGFLNVLSQTFDGGFLFGMPKAFFDIFLLWDPTQPIKRRRGKQARDISDALPYPYLVMGRMVWKACCKCMAWVRNCR